MRITGLYWDELVCTGMAAGRIAKRLRTSVWQWEIPTISWELLGDNEAAQ